MINEVEISDVLNIDAMILFSAVISHFQFLTHVNSAPMIVTTMQSVLPLMDGMNVHVWWDMKAMDELVKVIKELAIMVECV